MKLAAICATCCAAACGQAVSQIRGNVKDETRASVRRVQGTVAQTARNCNGVLAFETFSSIRVPVLAPTWFPKTAGLDFQLGLESMRVIWGQGVLVALLLRELTLSSVPLSGREGLLSRAVAPASVGVPQADFPGVSSAHTCGLVDLKFHDQRSGKKISSGCAVIHSLTASFHKGAKSRLENASPRSTSSQVFDLGAVVSGGADLLLAGK